MVFSVCLRPRPSSPDRWGHPSPRTRRPDAPAPSWSRPRPRPTVATPQAPPLRRPGLHRLSTGGAPTRGSGGSVSPATTVPAPPPRCPEPHHRRRLPTPPSPRGELGQRIRSPSNPPPPPSAPAPTPLPTADVPLASSLPPRHLGRRAPLPSHHVGPQGYPPAPPASYVALW